MPKLFTIALALALPVFPADVIFGRRVYSPQARSYQQIFTLDSRTGRTAPLTTSARRHIQPVCSSDGKRLWFLSGAFGNEANTELWSFDPRTKAEKLVVQFADGIDRLIGGTGAGAFFVANGGEKSGLYRWDGTLTRISRDLGPAAISSDGRRLVAQAGDKGLLTVIDAGGAKRGELKSCSAPAWSPDGGKVACAAGKFIRVVNVTTGAEVVHFEFTQRATPPSVADFSPDGARLLVGTVGANHSSTFPQSDFWVLDVASSRWAFVGPGQSAIFVPGGVLLVTPRELSTVGKGREWTSRLLLVNPISGAHAPMSSGATADVEPSRCPGLAAAAPRLPALKTRRRPSALSR